MEKGEFVSDFVNSVQNKELKKTIIGSYLEKLLNKKFFKHSYYYNISGLKH